MTNKTEITQAELGRFGHHPEPAIDFCIEVEELEAIADNAKLGLTGFGHEEEQATLAERIAKAMLFRVGADENCIVAKQALRELEDSLRIEAGKRATRTPTLLDAFRTTVSEGGKHRMEFRFPTIEALHEADREWHSLRTAALSATQSSHTEASTQPDDRQSIPVADEKRIIALGRIADAYEQSDEPHAFDKALDAAYDAGRAGATSPTPADDRAALIEALESAEKLIEDMSRCVGQMALNDYALFNELPAKISAALAAAKSATAAKGGEK